VRSAEGRRRQEDREGPGRVLDEDVAVGQRPVQEALRVALVDVDVTEARRSEEPAVGDRAGGDEDRDRQGGSAQRRPPPRGLGAPELHPATPGAEEAAARAAEEEPGPEAEAGEAAGEAGPSPAAEPWSSRWAAGARSSSAAAGARGSSRTAPA
jgi:hypothetical protein